ncbi:hypothetical protein [Clostridium taeniosporum]|uniref:Uncharacterized protein n=1 Tax=Clostridium taeniosporum TaxID=394958 RepID=A0A1D7XHH1_9CLOT|nr:hypothetical protein [Clostridium taeniosporum]AOR22801.1 hypothetical protein BGI42_03335 [Clostridium taeniosporum]
MLKVTVFEFIVRGIPEAFVLILGMFTLSNTKLNFKKYIISSFLLALCEYGIRMLPINYGVHTILTVFVMVIIMCSINKVDIILSIKSSLMTIIGLFICEALNMLLLSIIFNDRLEIIISNSILKAISGLPSLVLYSIIIIIYYLKKRNI